MFWKRAKQQQPQPDRPTDDQMMALLRNKIEELAPDFVAGSVVTDGILLGRHEPWAVMSLPNHTDSPQHFDLGFSTTLDRSRDGLIIDCIHGVGNGPAAVEAVLHIWGETSGACFLELATGGTGRYATHLRDDDPAAIPGWHTISSGVMSYGHDEASNKALQAAMLDADLLGALAADLKPALNRPKLNGIKVFLCCTPDSTTAEIRVNGEAAVLASEAMAKHPWPSVAAVTMARFYAVAVHPS